MLNLVCVCECEREFKIIRFLYVYMCDWRLCMCVWLMSMYVCDWRRFDLIYTGDRKWESVGECVTEKVLVSVRLRECWWVWDWESVGECVTERVGAHRDFFRWMLGAKNRRTDKQTNRQTDRQTDERRRTDEQETNRRTAQWRTRSTKLSISVGNLRIGCRSSTPYHLA